MFTSEVYTERRRRLIHGFNSGILLFPGNQESPMNYSANTYHFRQDSSFLYFFGLDLPNLAGVIDVDSGEEIIFGDDFTIDDIIWMGPQPSVKDLAASAGVMKSLPYSTLPSWLREAGMKGREVHYLPPYRGETRIQLSEWLGKPVEDLKKGASNALIQRVIELRSVKEELEIAEIEKAINLTAEMHVAAMKMAYPGIYEYEIAGRIEGIALGLGGRLSFPIILTVNGQILHNHYHGNRLEKGRMLVVDAGSESSMHYAGDITRTVPVGGEFNGRQRDIYEIVYQANMTAIALAKPGIKNIDLHLAACRMISEGLIQLGLMKGDPDEAVSRGAHALFFPHGLGHMLGLDVHDMEGLGENFVGYDQHTRRSEQFGLAYLRLARELKQGFVFTVEPGIYFIPALVSRWKKEKKNVDFINYGKVESFLDFGGVRIEDDVLITDKGARVLGKPIPKTVSEIEATMKQPLV